jgi:hypothetical protein
MWETTGAQVRGLHGQVLLRGVEIPRILGTWDDTKGEAKNQS